LSGPGLGGGEMDLFGPVTLDGSRRFVINIKGGPRGIPGMPKTLSKTDRSTIEINWERQEFGEFRGDRTKVRPARVAAPSFDS
jgi:hypothetical protein